MQGEAEAVDPREQRERAMELNDIAAAAMEMLMLMVMLMEASHWVSCRPVVMVMVMLDQKEQQKIQHLHIFSNNAAGINKN